MIDKIFAPFSILLLLAFMAVIVFNVPSPELIVIIVGVTAMAIYDFWKSFQPGGENYQGGQTEEEWDKTH